MDWRDQLWTTIGPLARSASNRATRVKRKKSTRSRHSATNGCSRRSLYLAGRSPPPKAHVTTREKLPDPARHDALWLERGRISFSGRDVACQRLFASAGSRGKHVARSLAGRCCRNRKLFARRRLAGRGRARLEGRSPISASLPRALQTKWLPAVRRFHAWPRPSVPARSNAGPFGAQGWRRARRRGSYSAPVVCP